MKLRNAETIKNELRRRRDAKIKALGVGFKRAGQFLFRKSQAIVPVDYGDLKGSGYVKMKGEGTPKVTAEVGYTSEYAIFVHENLEAAHGADFNRKYAKELAAARKSKKAGNSVKGPFRHSRGPNQQAKFLEQPFRENRKQLKEIIKEAVDNA